MARRRAASSGDEWACPSVESSVAAMDKSLDWKMAASSVRRRVAGSVASWAGQGAVQRVKYLVSATAGY